MAKERKVVDSEPVTSVIEFSKQEPVVGLGVDDLLFHLTEQLPIEIKKEDEKLITARDDLVKQKLAEFIIGPDNTCRRKICNMVVDFQEGALASMHGAIVLSCPSQQFGTMSEAKRYEERNPDCQNCQVRVASSIVNWLGQIGSEFPPRYQHLKDAREELAAAWQDYDSLFEFGGEPEQG
ncbi:MAG: hypothetical protein ACXWLH_04615 [Candidatus Saccharimonadales bacterium]